ncbi:hypothetical protein ANN_11155 [Periplaneta americana]|uniref:B box-type domain-containing protein n=1 Tax=Periplaneta americana TaxID=6978 RepID=A0ABQ8T5M1_PERAM|nr:hypothetical protein ANN_11155 [Periplaneta americana]
MSPGSSTESYPAFAHIGLRENPEKNLNQVIFLDRKSNPGHLVSRRDALTVTPQASSRCTDCLLSLCTFCSEAHQRQRVTAGHEVLALHEARQRGITRVRRQAMCPAHPELELQLFCAPCGQVACRECCLLDHRGHACDTATRAAQVYTRSIRDSLERARPMAEEAVVSLDRLRRLSKKIEVRCSEVQEEVDRFIDSYISALEDHRRALQLQVQEAHEAKLHTVHTQQLELERHAEDTRCAVSFAEDLLAEGSDIELLSLVVPVLRRLEWCCTAIGSGGASNLLEPRVSECLQFLPNESAGKVKDYTLFGVITTQTISHEHCSLDIDSLMDVRQNQKAATVLVTRDTDEQPLCHGGEKVTAEVWYRDASRRKIPIQVTDRQDGTYLISFVPDTSGNLSLSVSVQGKPIKICLCDRAVHSTCVYAPCVHIREHSTVAASVPAVEAKMPHVAAEEKCQVAIEAVVTAIQAILAADIGHAVGTSSRTRSAVAPTPRFTSSLYNEMLGSALYSTFS